MGQIQVSSKKTKPRSSCFLGCLGFSEKVANKKPPHDVVKSSSRKKTRWFSWSRKSATKTVPVDSEKVNRSRELPVLKSEKNPSKRHISVPAFNPNQIPAVVPYKTVNEKLEKSKYENVRTQNIIFENRENLSSLDTVKNNTCRKGLSSTRKRAAIKTDVRHPDSPETKFESGQITTFLLHSASLSPPKQKKQVATGGGTSRVIGGHKPHREFSGKFDTVVGMSIVMVILIIMLMWGKLCAILCTSAWFYFVPRLRTAVESNANIKNGSNSGNLDLNSEEYKKKVVLEGFLERKHRAGVGIL